MSVRQINIIYSCILLIVVSAFSLPVFSKVYSCVSSDGKTKYQDMPCKEQEKSSVVQTKDDDLGISFHKITVPNLGEVLMAKFKSWHVTTVTPKDSGLQVIRIEYPNPRDPLSVTINIAARGKSGKKSPQETIDTVKQVARPFIATSVEQATNLEIYKADLGTLIYATFTDKSLQNVRLEPGDFKKMTIGMMHHSRVIISYSILSNSTDMRAFKNLLLMLEHLKIKL
jgi:hypothetical protein